MATTDVKRTESDFVAFVHRVEPLLLRALVALRGPEDGRDATAEALAWAWEHWPQVHTITNPAGYLYRVGQSKSRERRTRPAVAAEASSAPAGTGIDEDLWAALDRLPPGQRTAILLVHGCDWTYEDTAVAMEVSKSTVGTHLQRGLRALRRELEEAR